MVNAQEWLDKNYPEDSRKTITKLEIDKYLETELNLSDFTNLTELIITPKRNWEEFYQWSNINIVDINEKGENKGNLKVAKRSEYPTLTSNWTCIVHLMNGIEYHLGKTLLDYDGRNIQNTCKEPVLPYDDTKTFFQLASGNGDSFKCGWEGFTLLEHQHTLSEYEKLLTEWRSSTNKPLTIKLEQIGEKNQIIQELKKQVYGYEKTNLEVLLTKKEQELKETKLGTITANNLNEDNQEELDNLLELQVDYLQDNLPSLEKQLTRSKRKLNKVITNEEISLLCRLQSELIALQQQEQELQAKIEILPQ